MENNELLQSTTIVSRCHGEYWSIHSSGCYYKVWNCQGQLQNKHQQEWNQKMQQFESTSGKHIISGNNTPPIYIYIYIYDFNKILDISFQPPYLFNTIQAWQHIKIHIYMHHTRNYTLIKHGKSLTTLWTLSYLIKFCSKNMIFCHLTKWCGIFEGIPVSYICW